MNTKRTTKPDAKRVGIWIRVSTEMQVKDESPETHERRARAYAEARGWTVVEVYRLDAVSGKSVREHPETKRMLADVRSGQIGGLIFSKLARLARNTKELLEFSELFREHGADLISLAESIDTSTPAGRLFYTMIAAMAQWEREEIAERVAASVPIRAQLGKRLGGVGPFGYHWVDGKLVPKPDEAPVRRLIYELFREHRRKGTVARLLNERGYRTRNGKPFTAIAIGRLIRDPAAKGLRRANYSKNVPGTKSFVPKPRDEWVLHPVEPIVSAELWDEANAILDAQEGTAAPPIKRPVQLFAGLTYCVCGKRMRVPSNTPKYVCGGCRNKIPVADLEAVFHEQLKGFFFSPEELAAELAKADAALTATRELLAVLEQEREKLGSEVDKLYDLYQSGAIDKSGFAAKYRPLAERIAELDEEIPKTQAEVDVLSISRLSRDEVIAAARDLYSRWPDLPFSEKRRIVETITEKVVVGKGDVTIDLYYAPPAPGSADSSGDSNTSRGSGGSPPSPETRGTLATHPYPCVRLAPYLVRGMRLTLKSLKPHEFPNLPVDLPARIRRRRKALGLTLDEAARELGVNVSTLGDWERGKEQPYPRMIPRILAFIGMAVEEARRPPRSVGPPVQANVSTAL